MVKMKIGRHDAEVYDAIDELPVVRFHRYQKFLMIDAGIGAEIADFDRRIEKARRYMLSGKGDMAAKELENLRQCVHFIQTGINPKHLAFAALVKSIDGRPCDDMSDDGLAEVTRMLSDVPVGEIAGRLGSVKKKIDAELVTYFQAIFADSQVKEFYDTVRRRALVILEGIAAGAEHPADTAEARKLSDRLLTWSNPQTFSGPEGAEVTHDRNFENICLSLSEQLHVEPKRMTVLEFYNAFDFLQERNRRAETAQKRRK